jgi:hypothetical protein
MLREENDKLRKSINEQENIISKEEIEERIDAMNDETEQKAAARREDDHNRQRERDRE